MLATVTATPAPVRTVAQVDPPTSREIIRTVLPHNVRVLVYDGNTPRRTASGVVVSVQRDEAGPTSFVVTNAHVLDLEGIAAPRFAVVVDRRAEETEFPARLVVSGKVPEMDLGLIAVPNLSLPPARLAEESELELGEDVIVAAAPFGRPISLSGGMVSHLDWHRQSGEAWVLKTDAAIGYGASGGGIYSRSTGKLFAIVEGYRTARVNFSVSQEDFGFDVPMPGETFAAPVAKVRAFLTDRGYGHLLSGEQKVAAVMTR